MSCAHKFRWIGAVLMFVCLTVASLRGEPVSPTTNNSDLDVKPVVVFRKECGAQGQLVVSLRRSDNGTKQQNVEYAFDLLPRGAEVADRISATFVGDSNPFASGKTDVEILDATVTSDPVLVYVFAQKFVDKDGISYAYSGALVTWENSGANVPPIGVEAMITADGYGARRRAVITGSYKDKNLTASLIGPKDTKYLRLELADDGHHSEWRPAAAAPKPAPTTMPATRPRNNKDVEPESRTRVVLRHDYGPRGQLVVEEKQTALDSRQRRLDYIFLLVPTGGGAPRELDSDGQINDSQIGDAEPGRPLLDAQLASDSSLFELEAFEDKGKVATYMLSVVPPPGVKLDMPRSSDGWLYAPDVPEEPRRLSVAGTLKNGPIVSLAGPKDTLRFGFRVAGKHAGWYPLDAFTIAKRWKQPGVPDRAPSTVPAVP